MGQRPALRVFGVTQQGGRRGVRLFQVFGIPRCKRGDLELVQQAARAQGSVKLPGRAGADGAALGFEALLKGRRDIDVVKQLAGRNARHPHFQLLAGAMGQVDLTLRDAEPGQAAGVACALVHGQQNGFGLVAQQFGVGQRAWRDDPYYLAFDRALAGGHVADLFADGDRLTELDEFGQVAFQGMKGHTGHDHRLARRLAAPCQRDVEQARGFFSIGKKDLIEVAHAVENQGVGVLCLDAQVLGHHRGMF